MYTCIDSERGKGMERINKLSNQFFKFKRDTLMEIEGKSLREYVCVLSITHELIDQAVKAGKDIEGNNLTDSEMKCLKSMIFRLDNEIQAIREEMGEGE